MLPWPFPLNVFELILMTIRAHQLRQLLTFDFQVGNIGHFVGLDALFAGGHDCAFAVREGDNGGPKLDGFEGSVLRDVSGA